MIITSVGALITILKEQLNEDDTIVVTWWSKDDVEGSLEDWEDVAIEFENMADVVVERGNDVLQEAITRVEENRKES